MGSAGAKALGQELAWSPGMAEARQRAARWPVHLGGYAGTRSVAPRRPLTGEAGWDQGPGHNGVGREDRCKDPVSAVSGQE